MLTDAEYQDHRRGKRMRKFVAILLFFLVVQFLAIFLQLRGLGGGVSQTLSDVSLFGMSVTCLLAIRHLVRDAD